MAFRIVIGDVTIGIQGQDFAYIFSVGMGGMESLYKDGKEWLYRAPRPAFWRAATDNDRGNGFVFRSAVWSAADRFVRCVKVTARMDEQEISMPPAPENNKYNGDDTNVSINTALGRMRYALINMRRMARDYDMQLQLKLA